MRIDLVERLSSELAELKETEWRRNDVEHRGAAEIEGYEAERGYRRGITLVAGKGTHLGLLAGWISEGMGYVNELMVMTEHRGKGVGTALLERFESECRDRSARRLALRVEHGTRQQRFYERLGWYEEAILDDWTCGETFACMRKDLDREPAGGLEIRRRPKLDGPLRRRLEELWLDEDTDVHGAENVEKFVRHNGYQSDATLVAHDGHRAVGFATGYICMGVGYLIDLIVDVTYRGRGLGAGLLADLRLLASRRKPDVSR